MYVCVQIPFHSVGNAVHRNSWHYDGEDQAVVLQLFDRYDVNSDVAVQVRLPEGQQAKVRPMLNTMKGLISRAKQLKPMLDRYYPDIYPVRYARPLRTTAWH